VALAGSLSVGAQPMLANRFSFPHRPEPHDWQFLVRLIWQDQFTALLLTAGDIGVTSK
jgi:hypothetical protein